MLIRPPLIGSTAVTSHAAVTSYVVFRSFLKISIYAAKQACKLMQCNEVSLLESASINGLHRHRPMLEPAKIMSHR